MTSFGLSLSLEAELLADLAREASGKGISVQQLIRSILGNYMSLKEHDE